MSFLPESDRGYLSEKAFNYREVTDNGQKGLILGDYMLPANKFDRDKADLLILLPQGYPDIQPDMFYLYPGIFLMPDKSPITRTQVNINFEKKEWQRWSRHSQQNDWRPGIDGIHTYLKKIDAALNDARTE